MKIINGIVGKLKRHSIFNYDLVLPGFRLYSELKTNKGSNSDEDSLMNMKGKIALITGGTSGIGLAVANELLRNELKHCFITGHDPLAGKKANSFLLGNYGSGKSTFLHLNVISSEQFEKVFQFAKENFGGIDILFNNAGVLADGNWELEVETNFKSMIRANLLGLDLMSQSKLKDNSERIIINNADVCALDPLPFAPVYSATKSAVLSLTKSFGNKYHYKGTKVRVVGLCCGSTDTELVKDCATKQLTLQWGYDTYSYLTRERLQKPEVIGRAIVHLIKFAKSGTIWTVENNTLYETKIPTKNLFNYKVSRL